MKRINLAILVFALAGLFAFVSCAKKEDGGGNGGVVATTPQPCNAYGPQGLYQNDPCPYNVNSPNYSYYNQSNQWLYGAWQWQNQVNIYATNCGCSTGYIPTFEAGYGVACVPSGYFGTVSYWYNVGYFPGPSVNGQWLNIPQMSYSQANQSCFKSLAVGCDTRMNNCPSGQVCTAATSAGSAIGICR